MSGHVFVVRGKLHQLIADDLLISTDEDGFVEKTWYEALGWERGVEPPAREKPVFRDSKRVFPVPARRGDRPRRWFVAVGAPEPGTKVAWLIAGVRAALLAAADAGKGTEFRGPIQRIAMPVMGVGRGGFDSRRGAVIDGLLRTAHEVADSRDVDVVLVAYKASDYSALQAKRMGMAGAALEGRAEEVADELAGYARAGRLALFLGAGTGIPAGLPNWKQLLAWVSEQVKLPDAEGLSALNPLDAAEILRRAADEPRKGGRRKPLGALVAERIGHPSRYALSHILLAALGADHAITTNFDQLYEIAVAAIEGERPPVVLPDEFTMDIEPSAHSRGWLLKLHGDVDQPKEIVLDRRSFVRYDANRRPLGGVLQTTLLTKHLLVVGASMTDDNVIRLIHEVAALDELAKRPTRRMGTILTLSHEPLRRLLWKPEFEHLELREDGTGMAEAGRQLEIFLDRVALLAAPRHTHLLDPRYRELLRGDEERNLARKLTDLVPRIRELEADPETGDSWRKVAEALQEFGAERSGAS